MVSRAKEAVVPHTGMICRHELGGPKFVVVGVDDRFVYLKGADEPKKYRKVAGAGVSSRGEWERGEWLEVAASR